MNEYFGGIEAGGTKFVCAIGSGPEHLRALTQFPTTTPEETIWRAVNFFQEQQRKIPINALGIGTFGPVDLNPQSESYGYITTTPKPGWKNTNLKGLLEEQLGIPTAIDTDVNAATGYLALALSNFICTLSPERIILGGGVMEQDQLLRMTRQKVQELLNGYIPVKEILEEIESYIVRPKLGNKAGVLGALALAISAGNLPLDINPESSSTNTLS